MDSSQMQRLVGVDVPKARYRPLIEEKRFYGGGPATKRFGQVGDGGRRVPRIRAQPGQAGAIQLRIVVDGHKSNVLGSTNSTFVPSSKRAVK